jgi:hypothetical protein
MKRILSVLAAVALVAAVGFKVSQDPFFQRYEPRDTTVSPSNTPSLVAPVVANDFFSALCSHDAAYLAANTGGVLAMPEEELAAYFSTLTMQCYAFRYLGSLTPTAGTTQFVYVMDYGADGELWYVLSVIDGIAVDLE